MPATATSLKAKQYRLARKIRAIRLIENGACACRACGETDPIVLQFDHILSTGYSSKTGVTSSGTRKGPSNVSDILQGKADAALYQVMCANCHVRKSYEERA